VSLLDLHGINPYSRLVKAQTDDVQDALKKIKSDLQREYFKPSLKSLKKKGSKTRRKNAEGPSFELVLGDNDRHYA